jgi:hypothetical protein
MRSPRRAARVTLEADNWRHHLRLAYVSWGEERLREAGRTLALLPGFPLAHWLWPPCTSRGRRSMTPSVSSMPASRAQASRAERSLALQRRCAALAARSRALARGDERRALAVARTRAVVRVERSSLRPRVLRQYVVRHRRAASRAGSGDTEAAAAFPTGTGARATTSARESRVGHIRADAPGTAPVRSRRRRSRPRSDRRSFWPGRRSRERRMRRVDQALAATPPGNAGWLLPIEPLLNVAAAPESGRRCWRGCAPRRLRHEILDGL